MVIPTKVVVHPIVLLSVVDHFNRVLKDRKANKRVVGVLLGEVFKGKVDVTNCYAVPFDEDDKNPNIWFLDHNYHEQMFAMFRKVSANERVIGWYSTGPKIRAYDLTIHETFRRYNPEPVFVIIDVKPKALELPTESYVSIEETDTETHSSVRRFQHLPTEVKAFEAEEIGVEHLLRDIKDVSLTPISKQVTEKVNGIKGLLARLEDVLRYLRMCVDLDNPRAPNQQIIYQIQDILNLLPDLSPEELTAHHIKANDDVLVVYLSTLVRSVIALHDLINNKMLNMRIEREEREKEMEKRRKDRKEDKNEEKGRSETKKKEKGLKPK